MKLFLLFSFLLAVVYQAHSQKLWVSPNGGILFGPLNYYPNADRPAPEFQSPRLKLRPTIGAAIIYTQQPFRHRVFVQQSPLGIMFKVVQDRPNQSIGDGYNIHSTSVDHGIIGYSFGVGKRVGLTQQKRLIVQPYFDLGVAWGTNRSQGFYDSGYSKVSGFFRNQTGSFFGYEYTVTRKTKGAFLIAEAGFALYNKKGKRFLEVDLFYYLGLRQMVRFDLDYYYGNAFDNWRVDRTQVVRTRGTTFGLKVGVPIRILKSEL